MLKDPQSIINEISELLQNKKENRSTVEIQSNNEREIKALILDIKTDLTNLKNPPSKQSNKKFRISVIAIIMAFSLMAFFIGQRKREII